MCLPLNTQLNSADQPQEAPGNGYNWSIPTSECAALTLGLGVAYPGIAVSAATGGSSGEGGGGQSDSGNPFFDFLRMLAGAAEDESLPALKGTIADSFKAGQYVTRLFKAGTIFYRAEAWNATGPGSFLGTDLVDVSDEAEQAYNLDKWNNLRQVMRIYRLNQGKHSGSPVTGV